MMIGKEVLVIKFQVMNIFYWLKTYYWLRYSIVDLLELFCMTPLRQRWGETERHRKGGIEAETWKWHSDGHIFQLVEPSPYFLLTHITPRLPQLTTGETPEKEQ